MMMSVADPVLPQYEWLVVVGSFGAFWFGFATGANDVANAFGTSVGAKALTLRQAVLLAAIFEFTGAMVLGRVSVSTIAGGIANLSDFQREPEMFAYGMVCALAVSGTWNVVCSYFELNVSSTHSIIGSIVGFSLVYGGKNAVNWATPDDSRFPPYRGVVPIIVSWVFSPILTATAAAILFFSIRLIVLRRMNSFTYSLWLLPFFVLLTVFVCLYFVFTRGAAKSLQEEGWDDAKAAWVAAATAAGCAVLTAVIAIPVLRHRTNKAFNEDGTRREEEVHKDAEKGGKGLDEFGSVGLELLDDPAVPAWKRFIINLYRRIKYVLLYGTSVDIHHIVEEDEVIAAIHRNAEVFDPKAEFAFQYLQVFSAICVVFSHGAGEVGYMAGPLATVWQVYTEGNITRNITAPIWAVFIGAFGLVFGLATYGYKVCRGVGVRLSKLSATRGFCAELSTALVIMVASQYGLPTSSSQCITGGIIGVGLLEGRCGVNWMFFAKQFSGWVSTLFVVGLGTAGLFAQGIYSPSAISGEQQMLYENGITNLTVTMSNNFRAALLNYSQPANASLIPRLTTSQINAWNRTLSQLSSNVTRASSNAVGTVTAQTMFSYLYSSIALYQYDTILTVGQVNVYPGANICSGNTTASVQGKVPVPCIRPSMLPRAVNATVPAVNGTVPVLTGR